MLYVLKNASLKGLFLKTISLFGLSLALAINAKEQLKVKKVDLDKVYNDAKNWASLKLDESNKMLAIADKPSVDKTSVDKRCYGDMHPLKKPCSKANKKGKNKNKQNLDDEYFDIDEGKTITSKEKILIFVSFSMPKQSLIELMQQASKYNAVLVIRGIKNNSFKQMASAIHELGLEQTSSFEINPELFKRFEIKQIPTFVLIKNDQEVSRLKGNVSLAYAKLKLNNEA